MTAALVDLFAQAKAGGCASDEARLALDGWASRQGPAELIYRLLNNKRAIAQHADQSYDHPNGFMKLQLTDKNDGINLRLHLWPRQGGVLSEDIHNHESDFSARIVVGSLRVSQYVTAETGEPYEHFSTEQLPGGAYRLSPSGNRMLLRCIDFEFSSMVMPAYSQHAEVLHHVVAHGDVPAVTLFLQGPRRFTCTSVYRKAPSATSLVSRGHRLDPAQFGKRLLQVLEILGPSHRPLKEPASVNEMRDSMEERQDKAQWLKI